MCERDECGEKREQQINFYILGDHSLTGGPVRSCRGNVSGPLEVLLFVKIHMLGQSLIRLLIRPGRQ